MTKVSSQPSWFVSFCLAFLRIQGIFLTGVNTENLQFLFKCCVDNMEVYLSKQENPSLLVSMIIIWIFSMHITVKELKDISLLTEHNTSLFDDEFSPQAEKTYELFYQFLLKIIEKIQNKESCWIGAILIFLYWVSSYRGLKKKFITGNLQKELIRINSYADEQINVNTHLLLPEDLSIIGFLPLNYYYLAHKDYYNEQVQVSQEIHTRTESLRVILNELLIDNDEETKKSEEGEENYFFSMGGRFDIPELTFEESKIEYLFK